MKMICKLPIVYNGKYHPPGDVFEAEEAHVNELSARCIPMREQSDSASEANEPKADSTKRRRKK